MKFLEKNCYWIIPLITIIAPIAINKILLFPACGRIVGRDTDWLTFWGNYLGGIIPALGAFVILYIQRRDNEKQNIENRETNAIENEKNRNVNEKCNEENRKNQNKIMLYQISTQNLHLFKESCLALLDAYNYNRFVQICNLFIQQKKSPIELIRIGFMEINKAHRSFLMNFIPSAPKMAELIDEEEKLFKIYKNALLDMEVVISYLTFSKDYIKEHISTDNQASETLSMIIAKKITMLESIEPKKWLDAILNQRLDKIDPKLTDSIWDLISDVYLGEKARVNKILM